MSTTNTEPETGQDESVRTRRLWNSLRGSLKLASRRRDARDEKQCVPKGAVGNSLVKMLQTAPEVRPIEGNRAVLKTNPR